MLSINKINEFLATFGDQAIGLHLATFAQIDTYDVIGYACASSPNFNEALLRLVRYKRLLFEAQEFTLEMNGQLTWMTHTITSSYVPSYSCHCQWALANVVLQGQRMTGRDLIPLGVGFQHKRPDDLSAYHNLFRAPLEFELPVNEVLFDTKHLQQPLLKAEVGLCRVLDRYAEELLANLPETKSFVDSVCQELIIGLRGGNVGLEAIANKLEITPRTFQRKLQKADTSYQEILDQMRHELSIFYIKEQQLAMYEVAFLLGFSDTSAFHRAFKRWTGKTPSEFRRTLTPN